MEQDITNNALHQCLAALTQGPMIEHAGLSITPLLGDDEATSDYLTLDEALAAGLAEVTEVSESGRVPELRFRNRAAKPVLVVDGEELVGAKQNRVVNLTILVAAQSDVAIPVSCVEAGRWHADSASFQAAPRAHFASGRADKMSQVSESLAASRGRAADQGAVWEAIAAKADRMDAHSRTSAMAAIFDRHVESIDSYVAAFTSLDRQRGALFAVHGQPAGIEVFDRAGTWRRLAPKLIRSYAIEALEPASVRPRRGSPAGSLLDRVAKADSRSFPALSLGADVRFESAGITGAALVADGRVLHLAAFADMARRGHRAPRPTL